MAFSDFSQRTRGTLAPGARHPRDLGDRRDAVAHLVEAVVAQAAHAVAHRDGRDAVGRGALDRERADLLGHRHHLVQADAALVAAAAAPLAAGGLVRLEVVAGPEAVVLEHAGREDRPLLAVVAERPREALRDDAVDRAR